jgi:lipid II:glycine glycyltransferase (peptidoglycan interpeptide bridge formation enzyme)
VERINRIVYLDLTRNVEDILNAMTQKRRYNIRRAICNPYLTPIINSEAGLAFFPALYQETMIRKGAELKFIFPGSFFDSAYKYLKEHLIIIYVKYGNEIIASALSLGYGEVCYGWLAGSRDEYYHHYPNDLCIFKSFTTAKARGYKYFVMGGGLAENDSLYKFKAEFSPLSCDFYIYKKIHHHDKYLELVNRRNRYSKKPADSFFPEYRSC